MLPGFGGHLVSEFFIESRLTAGPEGTEGKGEDDSFEAARADHVRRRLVQWRRQCRSLGPASSSQGRPSCGRRPGLRRCRPCSPKTTAEERPLVTKSVWINTWPEVIALPADYSWVMLSVSEVQLEFRNRLLAEVTQRLRDKTGPQEERRRERWASACGVKEYGN